MFAALTVVRLREAVSAVAGLTETKSWVSPDGVQPTDLPLAKAVEKVLGSMQVILQKTLEQRDRVLGQYTEEEINGERGKVIKARAAEVRLVRNLKDLRPTEGSAFKAEAVELGIRADG